MIRGYIWIIEGKICKVVCFSKFNQRFKGFKSGLLSACKFASQAIAACWQAECISLNVTSASIFLFYLLLHDFQKGLKTTWDVRHHHRLAIVEHLHEHVGFLPLRLQAPHHQFHTIPLRLHESLLHLHVNLLHLHVNLLHLHANLLHLHVNQLRLHANPSHLHENQLRLHVNLLHRHANLLHL